LDLPHSLKAGSLESHRSCCFQVMEGRIESGEVPYKAALAKDEIPAEYE
jgi:hypothetical protein